MKNFRYTLAASAILIITGVFLTGCNFPPMTSEPTESNDSENAMENTSISDDSMTEGDSMEEGSAMENDSMTDDDSMEDRNAMEQDSDSDDSADETSQPAETTGITGDYDIGDAGDPPATEEPTGDSDIGDAGVEADQFPASYIAYSSSEAALLNGKQAYAVFFHASWCPTCVKMEKDIEANLPSLPAGTVILEANFDNETALKKQYGISTQSTVVIINAAGEQVKTLSAPSAQQIADAIQAA